MKDGNLTMINELIDNDPDMIVPYAPQQAPPAPQVFEEIDPVLEEIESIEFYCVLFIVMLFFFVMAACNEKFKPKCGH